MLGAFLFKLSTGIFAMTEPETTLTPSMTKSYLSLKLGKAVKTGSRSQGYIHYRILKEHDQPFLHIAIVGNDGGGCYSKEIVPFNKVQLCLEKAGTNKTVASKLFASAFVGKSANNAGFMAAILRTENLLMPAPNSLHQHVIQADWATWKTSMLALASTAEHFQPEPPKARVSQKAIKEEPNHEDSQFQQQDNQDSFIATDIASSAHTVTGTGDDNNLSDEQMELLQQSALNPNTLEIEPDETINTLLDKQQGKKNRTIKRPHPTGQESQYDSALQP
jgi:hypothetical protein